MLIVYGIAFIIIEKRNKNIAPKCTNLKDFTYKAALIVGAFQVLALIPGTSRSRSDHFKGNLNWGLTFCCNRVFIFLRNSSNVWSKFFKNL